jgi:acetyl esterase/lipase
MKMNIAGTLRIIIALFCILITKGTCAQQIIALYPNEIPNSIPNTMKEVVMQRDGNITGYAKVTIPSLSVFLPDEASNKGITVIICPGGAYAMESFRPQGTAIAEEFSRNGITAFVLKYRLPSDSIMDEKSVGPLQDAQQAIKIIRENASKWNIDPNKIGIMGFSAGGHLASTAGTLFGKSYIPNSENTSLRPDFMVLVYPVISMENELTHMMSRDLLLGKDPEPEKIKLFSSEQQVSPETPPTWLTHAGDDSVVPVENSIRFYQALIANKVPAEMHLFPSGNHDFVLKLGSNEWMQPLFKWIYSLFP